LSIALTPCQSNSYLAFCKHHSFDLNPTPDTLSLFIAYMACQTGPLGQLISIQTINSYLLGISHHLQPYFPNVSEARRHPLVVDTLCGSEKTDGQPFMQKLPLNDTHLHRLIDKLGSSNSYNDLLFLSICFTAYHGFHLGELNVPDNPSKLNVHNSLLDGQIPHL